MTVIQVSPTQASETRKQWHHSSMQLMTLSPYSAIKFCQEDSIKCSQVLSHYIQTPIVWPSDKCTSNSMWRKLKMHTNLVCIYWNVLMSVRRTASFCKWASIWHSRKIMHPWLLTSCFPIRPHKEGKWVRGYPFDLWPNWAHLHREKCDFNFTHFNKRTHVCSAFRGSHKGTRSGGSGNTRLQTHIEVSLFSSVVRNPIIQK